MATSVPTEAWGEDELVPYQALIEKGLLDAVLTAHVFLRQFDTRFPATLSQAIIHGLLRERLGFDGLVFSDDLNMGAICRHYPLDEAIARCVEAGVDVLVHANGDRYDPCVVEKTVAILASLVRSGRLREERVDESLNRVLRLKHRIGLL